MLSQPLLAIRRAALLTLLCGASNAWAIESTEYTDYDGSYTISWNSQPIGCTEPTEYPYYPYYCYTLQENGVDISASGWSKAFSGQAVGSYEYQIYERFYLMGSLWSEGPIDGPVTVNRVPPTPGTPSGPSGTEYTGAYTISWSGSTGATSYQLYERVNSGGWSLIHNAVATSKAVSGRTPGAWEYAVYACASPGCSNYSGPTTVTVSAPATPGAPSGPNDDYDGAYTITWSAQTGATNYTLQERVNGGSWSSIHSASTTSKAVSGKTAGTWDYQVRAESGAGNSSFSSAKSVLVTLPPASAPSTPTGPTGTEYTGAYTISWGTVSAATNYRLEERLNSGSWSEIHNASGTSKAVSGRTPGNWDYRARACNVAGCGGYSSIKTVTVAAPSAPGTPSGPTGAEYTGAYTISWGTVTGASNYRLEERVNSGSWSEIHNASGASKAVSGKTPGTWDYRARACSGAGCSGYSGTKSVTVAAPATPGAPSGPSYSYGGSYTISWSAVTGAATYTLQERVNAGSWSTIHSASGTSKAVTATTYTEGTRDYQVRACSGAGCSNYSTTIAVSVILPPATSGNAPGAIPGGFSVGTQGDANYSIPITVPAGTGGLKPSLALSYNHLAGNGLAGMRWTLSGISTITRCNPTFAQDGATTATYDRYCLNGQRLVNVDGNYDANNTKYRTEIESFQRIVQQGTGASTSFYVDHGNGLRSYFGESSNSRHLAWGSLARTWYISRTVDRFGNTIAYTYNTSTADGPLPGTITWTGNTVVEPDLAPGYAVTITYESRPSDDQRSGYDSLAGTWSRTQRIDEIEVSYDDGTTVHEIATYALTYDATAPPSGTGRSTLTGVSVCRASECLPATQFTVQDGTAGWGGLTNASTVNGANPLAGDWNGDGRIDLFVTAGASEWHVLPGNASGTFDSYVDTNLAATTSPSSARVIDINGDGLMDLWYQDGSSTWKVAPSNGTTGFGTSINTGISTAFANPMLQDHDGDGLADVIYASGSGLDWRRNHGDNTFESAVSFYGATVAVMSYSTAAVDAGLRSLDADGDGRADVIVEYEECVYNPNNPGAPPECVNKYELAYASGATPHLFSQTAQNTHNTNFRIGDFNGDGLGDLMYVRPDGYWSMRISTGTGTVGGSALLTTTGASKILIADWDGDGRDDVLRPDSNTIYIHRSSGTTIPSSATASMTSTGVGSVSAFVADIDGSGHPEIVRFEGQTFVHVHNSPLADVVTDFTDGLGRTISVEYESLAETDAYTLDLGHSPSAAYTRRYGGSRQVVTTETHDDGIGGERAVEHEYDTAFVNTAGRGWQSFREHTITDAVQGTYSVTAYSQVFPTAGMVESAELSILGADDEIGGTDDRLIRSVDPEPTASPITGTTPERQFVRVEQTTTVEKEVGGSQDGVTLRTIVDNPAYNSTYGYVTETTRTVTQPGVTGSFVTTTEFDRGVIDGSGQWCLGLPGTVETSNSLPGGSPVTRTVDYQYNSDCSLDTATDLSEATTAKQLVREFGYDAFGNVVSAKEYSVAAGSSGARETTFDFDADGHFPESVTVEGVDLTTYIEFDPLLGVRTSVTGPDGLETVFQYDAFGRLTQEDRPAGQTDFTYRGCAGNACFAPNAAFYVKAADSTGATSYQFFDAFERPVGSDSPLAGGKRSRARTVYLANGQIYQRSLPYVAGESVHWITMTYDALGRTLTEDDEDSGTTATYEYLGHELKVTDGKSHATRYIHNALGQIKQVIDAASGTTGYTYRPFGELATVTDNASNVTTIEYDARGFKTDMYDPDMGHWEYDHNVYGELFEQTDAKAQVVTLGYDAAGRLISRDEDEGLTEWDYYPYNASAGQAGKLYQVTSPGGLIETYEYHTTNGQVNEILREIGSADYELDFAFDSHGRMTQLTYPVNVDSQRFGVEYLYDGAGVLSQVRNATTTSLVYYTLNEQDGSGATRRETLGNGVVEQYTYEPTTGRLASIKTGPTGTTLQDLEFEWDLAGNLEQREIRNASGTLIDTDVFNYDALDRLTSVVRDSVTTFSVGYTTDKLGNIASKNGISGTYSYGANGAGPHAVTSIGSTTFAYDANGNMTDRGTDIDIDWTSYNLPSRIERTSGEYSEFVYGADRSRYQQTEGASSLVSVRDYASPGLFEVLKWNSGASRVDYHYIHANGRAVAQFTTSNVEADELQYLHRDHQGSVVATSSTSGTVLDRFEYDAFGKRTVTAGDDDRSHRGYTGHEHLAALDLIHMNGRVQDPVLGRFLSPDPFVQAPYHSQSLNRYSYVWNNPMTMADPSGFDGVRCTDNGYCGDICKLNPGGPECEPNGCEGYSDPFGACMSIEQYRNREAWDVRTQAMKEIASGLISVPTPTLDDLAPSLRQEVINNMRENDIPVGPGEAGQLLYPDDLWGLRQEQIKEAYSTAHCTAGRCSYVADDLVYYDEGPAGRVGIGVPVAGITRGVSAARGVAAARAAAAAGTAKAVNLPAWRSVSIDMVHIAERHTVGGAFAAGRTVFPQLMSNSGIERAVRQAYRYGSKVATQGERTLIRGRAGGQTIEMWLNRTTREIETAYPIVR